MTLPTAKSIRNIFIAMSFVFLGVSISAETAAAAVGATATAQKTPLPFFDSEDLTPYWPADEAAASRKPVVLSAFHVVDQNEKPVNEQDLKKQITLVNFFFATCPGLCPTMMRTLNGVQKTLKTAPFHIYSFSVSPKIDTPKRLLEYTQKHDLPLSRWSLLTGDEQEIFRVGKDDLKADGAVGTQKRKNAFIHTANVYLIDRDLHLRGIYNTTSSSEMKLLAQDIARLRSASK